MYLKALSPGGRVKVPILTNNRFLGRFCSNYGYKLYKKQK